MAIGALRCAVARVTAVLAYPVLPDRMDSVRPSRLRRGHGLVTDRALHDLPRVSLQPGAVHVVIGLQRWVFGMLRSVAGRAIYAAVPGAHLEEALACRRLVGVGCERRVRRHPPGSRSGIECAVLPR